MTEVWLEWAVAMRQRLDGVERRFDNELTEIREWMVELDHGKARKREVEEIWTRLDALLPGKDAT